MKILIAAGAAGLLAATGAWANGNAPEVIVNFSPEAIQADGNTYLYWNAYGAEQCQIDGQRVPVSGSRGPLAATTKRREIVYCTNAQGVTARMAQLNVSNGPGAAIDFFQAEHYVINEGEAVALSWRVSNAGAVTLNGETVAATMPQQLVAPTRTQQYVLAADSSAASSLTVTVIVSDADEDGMPDSWEAANGLDGASNDAQLDADGDGLTNAEEYASGTSPQQADTDQDGMSDKFEHQYGLNPLDAADAEADNDQDGLTNLEEFRAGTNPTTADSDGDGLPDILELAVGLNAMDASDAALDLDGDGLSNAVEFGLGTALNQFDTDGDGMADGYEQQYGLNPLSDADAALDADGDGLSNAAEYSVGSNPLNADTDADGIDDRYEIEHGLNPLNAADAAYPSTDGLSFLQWYQRGNSYPGQGRVISLFHTTDATAGEAVSEFSLENFTSAGACALNAAGQVRILIKDEALDRAYRRMAATVAAAQRVDRTVAVLLLDGYKSPAGVCYAQQVGFALK